ncbi:MAG: DUF5989 family protein [candidate division NC10 bacterium]
MPKALRAAGRRVGIMGELLAFLWARKLWWLIPMVSVLMMLGLIMVLMCAAIAVQAVGRASPRPFVRREQLARVLKVLWPAVAMVVVMQWLGLYVAAALYTGFSMRWIGRHSWLAVAAVAVGFPLVTFFIFEKWCLVPMPKGPLEAWLGY